MTSCGFETLPRDSPGNAVHPVNRRHIVPFSFPLPSRAHELEEFLRQIVCWRRRAGLVQVACDFVIPVLPKPVVHRLGSCSTEVATGLRHGPAWCAADQDLSHRLVPESPRSSKHILKQERRLDSVVVQSPGIGLNPVGLERLIPNHLRRERQIRGSHTCRFPSGKPAGLARRCGIAQEAHDPPSRPAPVGRRSEPRARRVQPTAPSA